VKASPSAYGPNDSMMIVETFTPERCLLRPEEAIKRTDVRQWQAAVIDLNGHFAVAAPCYRNGCKQVILFNSMDSNALNTCTIGLAYDLIPLYQ